MLGACDCSDVMQSGLDRGDERPEQLLGLHCRHVPVSERRNRLRCVSSRLVLPRWRERTNQLRCRKLPRLNERDGADRLHAVPGWLRLLCGRDRARAVRAWHRDSGQRAELVCSLRCWLVPVRKRRHGLH